MLGLFEEKMTEPVILKENSSLDEQLKQLTEFLQKPLPTDVREQVEQDIRYIKYGISGEKKLLYELKNSHIPMFILRDIYIEDGDLSAQIDFIVITKKLFFVIECKNLYGDIEIDSKGNFIRTTEYGKTGIYSPITQNQRQLELLWQIREKSKGSLMKMLFQILKSSFYRAVVVLANEQTILSDKEASKEIREKVIRADQLIEYIKKEIAVSNEFNCSKSEMQQYAENFLNMHIERKEDYTQKYLKDIGSSADIQSTPKVNKQNGFCIRTGVEIPFDVKKPLSAGAYKEWVKFGNKNYPEKFCHFSGELSNGENNFKKPILGKNWEKAKEIHNL